MTDKEINNWIEKFSESNLEYLIVDRTFNTDGDLKLEAKKLSENLEIDYMEKELNLIVRFLSENKKANIVKLSKKGSKVVNCGGWFKYKEKQESKKSSKKRKEEFKYWMGIIIPFSMLLISFWQSKNTNLEKQNHNINEVQETQKQQIKHLKRGIQILSKKVDSVLLNTNELNESKKP